MSTTTIAPSVDADAERWLQWQLANAASSRTAATRARIVFTVILTALTAWVGVLLTSRL